MLYLKFYNDNTIYPISFSKINEHRILIIGKIPENTNGFTISRKETNWDNWDYKDYTTIYRKYDNGIEFSNDGSIYIEPKPKPIPETPKPHVLTFEEMKLDKAFLMECDQNKILNKGVEVLLSDGSTSLFSLNNSDLALLIGLQTQVASGIDRIPWHSSDTSKSCKYYSNKDMQLIAKAAIEFLTYHITYLRDLKIYIDSLKTEDELNNVFYGMYIPSKYQSEVLKDIYENLSRKNP